MVKKKENNIITEKQLRRFKKMSKNDLTSKEQKHLEDKMASSENLPDKK